MDEMTLLKLLLVGFFLTTGNQQFSVSGAALPPPAAGETTAHDDKKVIGSDLEAWRKEPNEVSSSGESSISLGFKPRYKKDVEKEADSANGKTPFYLFKKDLFYHPNTRKYLTSAFGTSSEKGFGGFLPFSGNPSGSRFQRSLRSFPLESLSHNLQALSESRHGSDETAFHPKDKESFLRLMALLAAKESENNLLNEGYGYGSEDELFQDGEDMSLPLPIELGYYGPFPGDQYALGDPETTNELSNLHLSQVPGTHGLYLSKAQKYQAPEINGEWLDDALPLQISHFKTRRSNPVMSHFRRYQKKAGFVPSSAYNFGYDSDTFTRGKFGPFAPSMLIRKRRSSAKANANPYTM